MFQKSPALRKTCRSLSPGFSPKSLQWHGPDQWRASISQEVDLWTLLHANSCGIIFTNNLVTSEETALAETILTKIYFELAELLIHCPYICRYKPLSSRKVDFNKVGIQPFTQLKQRTQGSAIYTSGLELSPIWPFGAAWRANKSLAGIERATGLPAACMTTPCGAWTIPSYVMRGKFKLASLYHPPPRLLNPCV